MKAKKSRGSKLSRSSVVTIRLDPMLNYLCDLAAKVNRQTKSSYIETAVKEAVAKTALTPHKPEQTVWSQASELWDIDETERFVRLALKYPELLSYEEQVIWKKMRAHDYYWSEKTERSLKTAHWPRLRADWEIFKKISTGEASETELSPLDPSGYEVAFQTLKNTILFGDEGESIKAQQELSQVLEKVLSKED